MYYNEQLSRPIELNFKERVEVDTIKARKYVISASNTDPGQPTATNFHTEYTGTYNASSVFGIPLIIT